RTADGDFLHQRLLHAAARTVAPGAGLLEFRFRSGSGEALRAYLPFGHGRAGQGCTGRPAVVRTARRERCIHHRAGQSIDLLASATSPAAPAETGLPELLCRNGTLSATGAPATRSGATRRAGIGQALYAQGAAGCLQAAG